MTIIESIILGIVQGLTELLPVSSSAHLNIFPWIFNWDIPESFDIALHLGTLLAITLFFYKDWIELFKGGYNLAIKKKKTTSGKLFWYIVIATIPAGIIGKIVEELSENVINTLDKEMIAISIALITMGIILYIVDNKSKSRVKLENMTFKQSFLIGFSQALAGAFPGVSRSGITMTVARMFKIDRESAAKYSFLLSTPMIAGSVVFTLSEFTLDLAFLLGIVSSFVTGLLVIKFLLEYLKKGSFKVFAIYRVLLGLFIIALVIIR